MATLEQLEAALAQADAAGAAEDAQYLADEIRRMRAAENPRNVGGLSEQGKIVRGSMTNAEIVQTLQAQLDDPDIATENKDKVRAEIARFTKVAPAPVAPAAPAAPAASQATVRAAEPYMGAKEEQSVDERRFEAARKGWRRATGGVLKPGQTENQAVAEWAKIRDPQETREKAEIEHTRETGEVDYGDSVAYNAAQMLAGTAGFGAAGPLGATIGNALVRAAALEYNLQQRIKAGAMTEADADEFFYNELVRQGAWDAFLNYGLPIAGQIVGAYAPKIPGVKGVMDRVGRIASKGIAKATEGLPTAPVAKAVEPTLRTQRVEAMLKDVQDPARRKAIRELVSRTEGDYIPTPAQATGESGLIESTVAYAFPKEFEKQEAALAKGFESMHKSLLYPGGQPTPQKLGERVVALADDTVAKLKTRLRPTWEAADRLGARVDMSEAQKISREALAKNASVLGGGKLTKEEVQHLQGIADGERWSNAESALDFMSVQKEKLRQMTSAGEPSEYFKTIVGKLTKSADEAYKNAARTVPGGGRIVKDLELARQDYKHMMETVYDDAVKKVLRKEAGGEPEAIGHFLWQKGKVSRIEQLEELLKLAQKEGTTSAAAANKMRRDVTRGFLQEAVQDIKGAATWSKRLKDPNLRNTWDMLTRGPEGKALRNAMDVLEQAAQVATTRESVQGIASTPLRRAAGLGIGISYVTGTIHGPMAVAGLGVGGMMDLMSKAYVHGDVGTINTITRALRMKAAKTGAQIAALQQALPALEKAAEKYGVALEDLYDRVQGEEEAPEALQ